MEIVEGDKVQIVKSTHINIPEEVRKYLGTIMTVAKVCKFNTYKMIEDKGRWIWDESLFEFKLNLYKTEKRKMLWEKLLKLTKEEDIY